MIKKNTLAIALLLFLISFTIDAQSPSSYTRANIMKFLKRPASQTDDLWPVIAHRGYWRGTTLNKDGNYYPENSLSSITRAHNSGIEAVELDVRVTKDGVAVLMHDRSIGRVLNTGFNPMTNNDDPDNVDLNTKTLAELRNFPLMAWSSNSNTKVKSSATDSEEDIPTLYEAVRHVIDKNLKVILVLDIFSEADLDNAYNSVKSAGGLDFCIFKIGSGGHSIGTYKQVYYKLGIMDSTGKVIDLDAFKRFHIAIILYEDGDQDLFDWVSNMATYDFDPLMFVEIPYRENYVSSDLSPRSYAITKLLAQKKIRTGHYWAQPTVTFRNYLGKVVSGYTSSSGYGVNLQTNKRDLKSGGCCSDPYAFWSVLDNITRPFVEDRVVVGDLGLSYTYIKAQRNGASATVITTDNIESLVSINNSKAKRNTNWYKCGNAVCAGARLAESSQADEVVSLGLEDDATPTQDIPALVIYPNPVKNEMNVEFTSDTGTPATFTLNALDGKDVLAKQYDVVVGINNLVIDTQNLANGLYVLKIQIGSTVLTEKVMIQK